MVQRCAFGKYPGVLINSLEMSFIAICEMNPLDCCRLAV